MELRTPLLHIYDFLGSGDRMVIVLERNVTPQITFFPYFQYYMAWQLKWCAKANKYCMTYGPTERVVCVVLNIHLLRVLKIGGIILKIDILINLIDVTIDKFNGKSTWMLKPQFFPSKIDFSVQTGRTHNQYRILQIFFL